MKKNDWVRVGTITASLVLGAVVWEVVGGRMNRAFMAPLSETLVRLVELVESGVLLNETLVSLSVFLIGFTLATLCGTLGGLVLARVPPLRIALDSYITMFYATPMVALIPFILSMMGFGFAPKVLVVFLFAVFPVLFNTVEGARSIKPELVDVARSFRSNEWALWRDLIVPHTLPYTATGIRQAIARGLVGMIAAEFFLSPSGLGQLIMLGSYNFDIAGMLAAILIIVALGVVLLEAAHFLERRLRHGDEVIR